MIFWILMQAVGGELRKLFIMNSGVLLFSVLLHYFCPILLPWSVDCALYAVSFLTFGKALAEYGLVEKLSKKPLTLILIMGAFVGLSLVNGSVNMEVSCFVQKYADLPARGLAWLGRHTMPVLCLHLFVYSVIGLLLF